MIIRIDNPDVSKNEKCLLTAAASDGDTLLTVDNSEGFSNDDYLVVGEMGEGATEIVQVDAAITDDHSLTVTALKHDHPANTPVYYIAWNQYSLDHKPSGGSYANIGTFALEVDQLFTEYNHTAGATTTTYRFRFYNSTTAAYSSYSDAVVGTGYGRKSARYMTDRILARAQDEDAQTVTREQILQFLNAGQDYVFALFERWPFLWKEGAAIASVASQQQYALPSDFGRMDNLYCHFDDGTSNVKYRLQYLKPIEFDYETRDQDADEDDDIVYWTYLPPDSTYAYGSFKVWPIPENAYHDFYPRYYKKFTDLDSDGDETDLELPSILENFALAEIEGLRGNRGNRAEYLKEMERDIRIMVRQQKVQIGQPVGFAFKGRTNLKRFFGERHVYSDAARENYW